MKCEKELIMLLRNTDKEIIEALTKLAKAMLQQQMAKDAVKYKSLLISPSEAAEIIERAGGSTVLMINYGLDMLRYSAPQLMKREATTRMLWTAAYLLEAGRIMGIRQERARRKERKHERA